MLETFLHCIVIMYVCTSTRVKIKLLKTICVFIKGSHPILRANQTGLALHRLSALAFWYCKFYHEVRKIWIVKSRGQVMSTSYLNYLKM